MAGFRGTGLITRSSFQFLRQARRMASSFYPSAAEDPERSFIGPGWERKVLETPPIKRPV
jgi:hypothetical protein